jgi:hypothetical protein
MFITKNGQQSFKISPFKRKTNKFQGITCQLSKTIMGNRQLK